MTTGSQPFLLRRALRIGLAALCTVLLLPGDVSLWARSPAQGAAQDQEPKLPPDQLDSLVAPIALYPDPLLAQVLAASTYPLQLIQLQQWLGQNKGLKDQALADAVQKQDWDPSIQGLAGLPDVVKRLADDIKWTTDLGNAFLSQESEVMDAVQRMRAKAQDKGNLKSNEQMKVETKAVESKQVIVIEQANPQVVYVPSYEPTVVYGPPAYPYPPIYYPPPGYYAAGMAISFGVGMAMGAMFSGGWGYGCGWGGNNNININNNNNFNRNSNVNGGNRNNIGNGNRGGAGGNGKWSHNPANRGGTPYKNKSTADRFGGTTRGSSQGARQASARQQVGRGQASGNFGGATGRGGGAGAGGRGGASAGTMDRGAGGRGGGAGGNRAGAGGGADRVGNRSTSGSRGSSANGFGGSGRNSSGSGARASSSRGGSSMGGSRGGGSRGGGGGRRR